MLFIVREEILIKTIVVRSSLKSDNYRLGSGLLNSFLIVQGPVHISNIRPGDVCDMLEGTSPT